MKSVALGDALFAIDPNLSVSFSLMSKSCESHWTDSERNQNHKQIKHWNWGKRSSTK